MGNLFAKIASLLSDWSQGEPKRILMLGLDAAGKTTILFKVKLNETVATIPTIGFNVEQVQPCKGVTFTVWDIGGQEKLRPLWQHYFLNSQGLLYIVDSNDRERLSEVREELHKVLADDRLAGVPIVVVANKQDLPYAMSPTEVGEKLGLRELSRNHETFVQGAVATSGEGIYEAMEMMARLSKKFAAKSSTR